MSKSVTYLFTIPRLGDSKQELEKIITNHNLQLLHIRMINAAIAYIVKIDEDYISSVMDEINNVYGVSSRILSDIQVSFLFMW